MDNAPEKKKNRSKQKGERKEKRCGRDVSFSQNQGCLCQEKQDLEKGSEKNHGDGTLKELQVCRWNG